MSRAQAILQAVVAAPGSSLRDIVDALGLPRRANITGIAAQVSQLASVGKLRIERASPNVPNRYHPTPMSLVDRRLRATGGTAKASKRPKAGQKSKPKAKPVRANAKQPQPRPSAPYAPPTKRPQPQGDRETVEEFLARGGRVQKLKPGETSTPIYESVRVLNEKTIRKRLIAHADNDPDIDDAFANVA